MPQILLIPNGLPLDVNSLIIQYGSTENTNTTTLPVTYTTTFNVVIGILRIITNDRDCYLPMYEKTGLTGFNLIVGSGAASRNIKTWITIGY